MIIKVSSRIGLLATIVSLLLISLTGAALAKREGYNAISRIQEDMRQGRMPGDSLIDGALVLAGALLLLTPGYITDAAALLLLIPPLRRPVRALVKKRLERAVTRRTVRIFYPGDPQTGSSGNSATGTAKPPENGPEQYRKELDQ